MPDTKSGIKHLSNLAQMHQNICISIQGFYKKQFKSNMKVYSKEMNHIREDLTRLRTDRERYQKQDEAHKKAMKLSSMSASTSTDHLPEHSLPITRSDAMQQLRQHNNINNKLLNDKVNDFSKRVASRRWSGSTIPEEDEDNTSLSAKETAKTAQGDKSNMYQTEMGDDSVFEEGVQMPGRGKKQAITKNIARAVTVIPTPTFKNDRFVNSTVNTARSKLAALYQQAVIGPASYKRKPVRPPSKPSVSAAPQRNKARYNVPVRSQSSLGLNQLNKTNSDIQKPARSIKSAQPKLRHPHTSNRRKEMLMSGPSAHASLTFEDEEQEADMMFQRRQRKLNQIREALTSRYQEFEEALHRRMMIRDMKAAEYDANHRASSQVSLHEILPHKAGTAISSAIRRQSALIALERSYIG